MADVAPRFGFGVFNAWLLCVPILVVALYLVVARREAARRMADMTGYTPREKLFTVAASLTPYPFMGLAVCAPFTSRVEWLVAGLVLYSVGLGAYVAACLAFVRGTGTALLDTGVYGFSRNPLYVSAALMFVGIGVATANVILLAIQTVALVLQHFMILAEERSCRARFGASYEAYSSKVPRYVLGI
jgi:protein-S-isoprenylcysteine O-methyltransferase Ste14